MVKRDTHKILLIGPIPPPMGGIVRYCQDIINSDLGKKNEIVVFRDNIPQHYRPSVTTAKNTLNIIGRDGFLATLRVFGFVFYKFGRLVSTLARRKYDVMHVLSTAGYGFFRNTVHIVLANMAGVKTVFHLLGQIDDMYRDAGPFLRHVISFCLTRADVHIVQSPLLAEFLRGITKRPVYSVFNGVDTELLASPGGYAHSSGDTVEVVTVAYLGYQKGIFDILKVARAVRDTLPDVRFTFVGGGEVEKFKNLAENHGVSDRVRFLGRVDDSIRLQMLQSSDIFLLPSHAEGQPIALLEAMAAGLPVISTPVGSIKEVVKEGTNGFLCNPGDISAISSHLGTLVSAPSLREQMGRYNLLEAGRKYEFKRVACEIQEIYSDLTKG